MVKYCFHGNRFRPLTFLGEKFCTYSLKWQNAKLEEVHCNSPQNELFEGGGGRAAAHMSSSQKLTLIYIIYWQLSRRCRSTCLLLSVARSLFAFCQDKATKSVLSHDLLKDVSFTAHSPCSFTPPFLRFQRLVLCRSSPQNLSVTFPGWNHHSLTLWIISWICAKWVENATGSCFKTVLQGCEESVPLCRGLYASKSTAEVVAFHSG